MSERRTKCKECGRAVRVDDTGLVINHDELGRRRKRCLGGGVKPPGGHHGGEARRRTQERLEPRERRASHARQAALIARSSAARCGSGCRLQRRPHQVPGRTHRQRPAGTVSRNPGRAALAVIASRSTVAGNVSRCDVVDLPGKVASGSPRTGSLLMTIFSSIGSRSTARSC
jgi:hypothetical protein